MISPTQRCLLIDRVRVTYLSRSSSLSQTNWHTLHLWGSLGGPLKGPGGLPLACRVGLGHPESEIQQLGDKGPRQTSFQLTTEPQRASYWTTKWFASAGLHHPWKEMPGVFRLHLANLPLCMRKMLIAISLRSLEHTLAWRQGGQSCCVWVFSTWSPVIFQSASPLIYQKDF